MMNSFRTIFGCGLLVALIGAAFGAASDPPNDSKSTIQFNRDIRPILTDNCFACHGPDKNKRKGKFRLDDRESVLAQKAIVPGKPDESSLIARIFAEDETEVMPPPETHKKLTNKQKELLKRWIAQGAPYQAHWAYIVPSRPPIPDVKNKAWVKSPIDAFVLAKLESQNIQPSPIADRGPLIRRLSLDLTGLPATVEELDTALKSSDPHWYEQAIDRLLASPHYGERMAVPWLDLVRFADTVGFHGDQNQRIFPYRDYVINAFNDNMPFDQFTREQIAGDLLPHPTVDQLIATGFNRLNMMTREGGAQPKEYLAKYAADRVRTVAGTWLGSTMGCAECHNHKYDPFTQKDFYSMAAYFADLKQWGVYQDYGYTPNPDLRGWSNDHPFPPEIEVESPALKKRMEKLQNQITAIATRVAAEKANDPNYQAQFEAWLKQIEATKNGWITPPVEVTFGEIPKPAPKKNAKPAPNKSTDKVAEKKPAETKPAETAAEPEVAQVQPDGSVLISGPIKSTPTLALKLPAGWLSTIKLELLPQEKHKNSILRNNAGNVSLKPAFFIHKQGEEKETAIAFRFADADRKEPIYRNTYDLLGIKEVWRTVAKEKNRPHVSLWWLDQPTKVNDGDQLIVKIPTNLLGCLRVSVSPEAPVEIFSPSPLGGEGWGEGVSKQLTTLFLRSTGWNPQAFAEIKQLEQRYHECRHGKAFTQISESTKPIVMRVLPRGNWQNESGEIVQPTVPDFLANKSPKREQGVKISTQEVNSSQSNEHQTRLDLANWLTSPDNPLTARVLVNRLWKQFFGTGLSAQTDDFGARGEWPMHPELLDWLAVEFRESGWNIKHVVKLMVMSNTYRQSAVARFDLKEIDPNNRLLAAQSPHRLEAEFIRDQALFVSGLLNPEYGGPSAFPYQPAGYYSQLQFPDRDYYADRDERQYRRGIYTHWQRTFLHPMLANFDAPPREECTANRTTANTPQQALTLLNDPTFVEAARVLAEHLLQKEKTDQARIERAYRQILSRDPQTKESESLLNLLANQREYYQRQQDDAKKLLQIGFAPHAGNLDSAELAAWTSAMRVLLNLHETITRY